MSQTHVRRCQRQDCRTPLVTVDHGKSYPLAGVVVLCFDPMTVKCPVCNEVSAWETAKAR